MNARRLFRIFSRPFHSATPRRQVASSTKQSKPLPKVLSSISFQKASSQSGGAVLVNVIVVIVLSGINISLKVDDGTRPGTGADRSAITEADMGGCHCGTCQLSLISGQIECIQMRLLGAEDGRIAAR